MADATMTGAQVRQWRTDYLLHVRSIRPVHRLALSKRFPIFGNDDRYAPRLHG